MQRLGNRNFRIACDTCLVRNRALCRSLDAEGLSEISRVSIRKRVAAGAPIFHEGESTKSVAVILSGVVKLLKTTVDGREQIVALQFPSEFIGQPFDKPMRMRAEAATTVELCSIPRSVLEALMSRHPQLGLALLEETAAALDTARQWMLTLGRKSAAEKVASFLVHMVEQSRQAAGCQSADDSLPSSIELPLSRTEISQFLGIRLETVSRQFQRLKSERVIKTAANRKVSVLDLPELRRLADTSPE